MSEQELKVGGNVWLISDEKLQGIGASEGAGDRFCGTITRLSKLRICVRFGHTGFGQRVYVFTNKGEPAPYTGSNILGKCHLELP